MTKIVLPISGGMDSTVLLHKAAKEYKHVYALSFNYNQRHINELIYAKYQANLFLNVTYKVIDVSFIRDIAPTSSLTNNNIDTPNVNEIKGEAQPKSYVPNRNVIFLSIATAYAEAVGAEEVWHGAAQADSLAGYWDGSIEFIEQINKLNELNRDKRIKISAPLIDMSKADIIKLGVKLGVDFSKTYTCYSGNDLPDATTASSSLRLQGFIQAGIRDPLVYKQQDEIEKVYTKNGI